jgi:hypothetical protein
MGGHFVVVKPKVVGFKGLCEAKPTMGLILVKPMAKGFTSLPHFFPPLGIIWEKMQKHWGGGVISKNEMLAHSEQTMGEH